MVLGIEQSTFPRVITACYEDIIITIIRGCVKAAIKKVEHPPLSLVIWVRERVYDLLGLCQTGNEFLDGYTYAIESALLKSYCTFAMFRKAIRIIAIAEPNTSYRNPISLEKILLDLCIAFWETSHLESDETLYEIESKLPIDVQHIEGDLESSETTLGSNVISRKDKPKKTSTTGVRKPKKGSKDISGNTIIEPKKASKPKPGPRAKKPKTEE